MGSSRPAAGGGRWVEVDPVRLARWLEGFRERHGGLAVRPPPGSPPDDGSSPGVLVVAGADGAIAELHPPPGAAGSSDLAGFLAGAGRPRRLGLLLARKSAAAVGVADGTGLTASKVDSWYVQSRTAAGGQSQQRFARRRANQATAAAGKAADIAARILLPTAGTLAALVTGGDRRTVEAILSDPRLAPLVRLRASRHLDVPTPNLAVLREAARRAGAVAVRYVDAAGGTAGYTGRVPRCEG
jgi:hypothetical protein